MGLDMYLTKSIYIGANFEHRNVKGTVDITANGNPVAVQFDRINAIEEHVAYWRKANHIHCWFVENVQDGVDNCGRYYVSTEQLQELLKLCQQVDKNHDLAGELLPTQSGFFFGGTEYDGYYFQDIKDTIGVLTSLFAELDAEEGSDAYASFYYQSSW
jgi:hypothetical protein